MGELHRSIKHGEKLILWEKKVGYSIDELKNHLEKQFKDGMTWNKFMNAEIHIDHIVPVSLFNYKTIEENSFKLCWQLDNLRPLWKGQNLRKNNILPNGKRAHKIDEKITTKEQYTTFKQLILNSENAGNSN